MIDSVVDRGRFNEEVRKMKKEIGYLLGLRKGIGNLLKGVTRKDRD